MVCTEVGCRKKERLKQLRNFYVKLCDSILVGRFRFTKKVTKRNKYKVIPGWNRNVKHLYADARESYFRWLNKGRQRDCQEFERMKETCKLFKDSLNDCKLNEAREPSISIQEKFLNRDMKSFWKGVQQKNNRVKYSEVIDGKNSPMDMIDIFSGKFLLTDSMEHLESSTNFMDNLRDCWLTQQKFFPRVSS